MIKSGMSDLFFTILISPYPTGQLAHLEKLSLTILSSAAMATGFCNNAPSRSRLDKTIQMLLGTPPNKGPHSKQCMKSRPHRNFRQVH